MTFREKLALEHPEKVAEHYFGGCSGCPCDYGYEDGHKPCDTCADCTDCWDREIPVESQPSQAQQSTDGQPTSKDARVAYLLGVIAGVAQTNPDEHSNSEVVDAVRSIANILGLSI